VVSPVFQAAFHRRIGSEVLLHGTQATVLDRGASLDDAGDRGGPTLGRLPEGVSHERARCARGDPIGKDTPRKPEHIRRGRAGSQNIAGSGDFQCCLHRSSNSKPKPAIAPIVICEIDIWRVAVLMVNRYGSEAEGNSFQRAEELTAEGDHAGAAVWRRVTVAIEQLTDTTGPLN
jgi:hypothetical protein